MKLIINIQKKYATYIFILFAVLSIEIAINYASAVPLQWHPLSEFSFDDEGGIVITTSSGDFNSTYLDGPINVSTRGNVGIGIAPSSNERLTISKNMSILSAESGIIFPDGTFMNSCLRDNDGDGYANDMCNSLINDYCDNNVTAWLVPNTDTDNDLHASSNACPGGAKPTDDYCDSNAAAWFPQNKDADVDGHSPFNTCPGGVKPIDDYCDGTAGAWLAINTDSDVDGHSPAITCPGGAKPRDDCNDACATCYPGSTAYTCAADGLDQDCSGTADNWNYTAWVGISGWAGAAGTSIINALSASGKFPGCATCDAVRVVRPTDCDDNIGWNSDMWCSDPYTGGSYRPHGSGYNIGAGIYSSNGAASCASAFSWCAYCSYADYTPIDGFWNNYRCWCNPGWTSCWWYTCDGGTGGTYQTQVRGAYRR